MSQMMMVALKTRHLRGCGSKPVHGLIAVVCELSTASLFKKAIYTFINHHYLKKIVPEASKLAFNFFGGIAVKNARRFYFYLVFANLLLQTEKRTGLFLIDGSETLS